MSVVGACGPLVSEPYLSLSGGKTSVWWLKTKLKIIAGFICLYLEKPCFDLYMPIYTYALHIYMPSENMIVSIIQSFLHRVTLRGGFKTILPIAHSAFLEDSRRHGHKEKVLIRDCDLAEAWGSSVGSGVTWGAWSSAHLWHRSSVWQHSWTSLGCSSVWHLVGQHQLIMGYPTPKYPGDGKLHSQQVLHQSHQVVWDSFQRCFYYWCLPGGHRL